MKLNRVLHNNVVVKQLDEEESKYGNIVIPDMGKEIGKKGTVIQVGPGSYTLTGDFIPTSVTKGEIVCYPAFGGQKVIIDNEEFFVFKEQDLLVVLEKEFSPITLTNFSRSLHLNKSTGNYE